METAQEIPGAAQEIPVTSSWWIRNRYWFFALVAVLIELFLLWFFGPVAAKSGALVLRLPAGVLLLLGLAGSTLWLVVAANIRLVQVVRARSGWLRYPLYAVSALFSPIFALVIAILSLVASIDSFGSESYYYRYETPEGKTVIVAARGFFDPEYTYHLAHGPFFREYAEYDGDICELNAVKPKHVQSEPPEECGSGQTPIPDSALPPDSQRQDAAGQTPFPGYDVDPNARPTGEQYFTAIVPASGSSPKVRFWAYSSASASALQRSVNDGAPETVTHPQGSEEALRFLTSITRLGDGRLKAVVGYPSWVDADVTEVFFSDDDGQTWSH